MNAYRRTPKPSVAREPVQVYLDGPDQERLDRLTTRLEATKSDVLRRGLEALERQVLDPASHPALAIAGIMNSSDSTGLGAPDAARDHDRVLADGEEQAWMATQGD